MCFSPALRRSFPPRIRRSTTSSNLSGFLEDCSLPHRPVAPSPRSDRPGRRPRPIRLRFQGGAKEAARLDQVGGPGRLRAWTSMRSPSSPKREAATWRPGASRGGPGSARPGCRLEAGHGQGPAEAGDHHRLVDRRADVGDAEFERLDVRRGADVPVDLRGVLDDPGGDQGRDQVVILGPRGEVGGDPAIGNRPKSSVR